MRRSHKFLKNISFGMASKIWYVLLSLISTPYIVKKLGTDAYGILAITLTVIGYFALTDFGMVNTVVKYLSEYLANKKESMVRRLIQTSFLYYFTIGLLGSLLIYLLTPLLVNKVLDIPEELIPLATNVFYVLAINFTIKMLGVFLRSILKGYQRFELLAIRHIGVYTISILITVLLLTLGYGLFEIALFNLFRGFVNLVIFYVIARKVVGFQFLIPKWDKELFAILFHFSKWKFIGSISSKFTHSIDRVLISSVLNISQLTYYVVPMNLAQFIGRRLISTLIQVIYPFMSESAAIDDQKNQEKLYYRTMKWIFLLLSPLAFYLLLFGDKFLFYWMGADFSQKGKTILWILSIAYLWDATLHNDVSFIEARGNARLPAVVSVGALITNISLNIILLPVLGIMGAAIAFAVTEFIFGFYFKNRVIRDVLDSRWSDLFRTVFMKPVFVLLGLAVLFFPLRFLGHSLPYYIVVGLLTGCIVMVFYYRFGCFDAVDKEIIFSFFKMVKEKTFQQRNA